MRKERVGQPDGGSGWGSRLAAQHPSVALLIQELGRAPRLDPARDPSNSPIEFREAISTVERESFLGTMPAEGSPEVPLIDDGTHRERLLVLGELCRIGDGGTRERAGRELLAMRSDSSTIARRPRAELVEFCERVRACPDASALIRSVAAAVERTLQDGGGR